MAGTKKVRESFENAMAKFRDYREQGRESQYFIEAGGGPPRNWWFKEAGVEYPLKAVWATASGINSRDTHTQTAKIELAGNGYGHFFEKGAGRRLPVVEKPNPLKSLVDAAASNRGGGEGEDHIAVKEFVSKNPAALGLPADLGLGIEEYPLPSGDRIDVVFVSEDTVFAIEVKPPLAPDSDVLRGLFQCVKYQAVLEAMRAVGGKPKVHVALALAGSLPPALFELRKKLGIDVVEGVSKPKKI